MKDTTQRLDIRNVFQPGSGDWQPKVTCCSRIVETWDIDYHIYDSNSEIWDIVYYLYVIV